MSASTRSASALRPLARNCLTTPLDQLPVGRNHASLQAFAHIRDRLHHIEPALVVGLAFSLGQERFHGEQRRIAEVVQLLGQTDVIVQHQACTAIALERVVHAPERALVIAMGIRWRSGIGGTVRLVEEGAGGHAQRAAHRGRALCIEPVLEHMVLELDGQQRVLLLNGASQPRRGAEMLHLLGPALLVLAQHA